MTMRARTSRASVRLTVASADAVGNRIFVNGNDAAALGCVYGGATVAAWYPITPSTSLAEAFMKHCRKLRVDPETKKNNFAIVQAEDEISAIGTVIGAGWNGRALLHRDLGPGHLADAGIPGPRLFRGNSRRDLRRAARRALHRHADAHAAGRYPALRLCEPRRHQACAAVPRRPARAVRIRRAVLRSGRTAADADLRDGRPRHRHERLAVRALRLGRFDASTTAAR